MKHTFIPCICFVLFSIVPTAFGSSGTWLSTSHDGDWGDASKWQNGQIADGYGDTLTLQAPDTGNSPGVGEWVGGWNINLNGTDRTLQNITLSAGTWSSSLAYRLTGVGDLEFAGSGTPTISSPSAAATILEIAPDSVSGNQGITFATGTSRVYWNPGSTTMTGNFSIAAGNAMISRAETLGAMTIRMSGSGPRLYLAVSNGASMNISNNIVLALNGASQAGGFVWNNPSTGIVTVSGNIEQSSAGYVSQFAYQSGTGGGQQRFIVSGNNSYKGTTTIGGAGAVLVLAKSGTALGDSATEAAVTLANTNAGLGLAGNIKIENRNLTLNGSGYNGTGFDNKQWVGSLYSHSGTNEWAGKIALGSTTNPSIGVAAGSHLLVSGVVEGSASGGLHKVGDGTLEFANANTYSTGTTIDGGMVLVSHVMGLGTGQVKVNGGGVLAIKAGIVSQISSLDLVTTNAKLNFSLNALTNATGIIVSGNQLGSGSYTVDIRDGGGMTNGLYTLLTVTGTAAATNFQLGSIEGGYQGSNLNWANNVLTLNVVPEPGVTLLFCVGLGLVIVRLLGRKSTRIKA